MEFLVRFVQVYEPFRRPELEALAELNEVQLQFVDYHTTSPFGIVKLPSVAAAKSVISRAILCKGVYELWGRGSNYDELHQDVKRRSVGLWQLYERSSFKFFIDGFRGSRSADEQKQIVESFSYMDMKGQITMNGASEQFVVFEHYEKDALEPSAIALGRLVGGGARAAITTYSLKKRKYLSTTCMDSELALIGANLALAAPGKIVYDPFIGTGSLPLACSHFGALAYGSDLDGRALRGKDGINVKSNFTQYGLQGRNLGSFVGDLTHSPLRRVPGGWLDAIVCDPPYGVREGLRVLGSKDGKAKEVVLIDGRPSHLQDNYLPPKKPYSFERMLLDILQFSAEHLVENGRLSFWMPTANDEEQELAIPHHPCMELKSDCIQPFNKWSRRLLTYRRLAGDASKQLYLLEAQPETQGTADDLNNFRKRYFQGFKKDAELLH